jgi:hypothetical protein
MSMQWKLLPAKDSTRWHALLYLFYAARGMFVAQADEIRPQYLNPDQVTGAAIFQAGITRDVGPTLGANISAIDAEGLNQVGGLAELATPWYSDQILPFDITLAASNEYGAMAGAKILGVEILNEGTGVSIDDTVTETQATFRDARSISRRLGVSIRFRQTPPSRSAPAEAAPGPPKPRLSDHMPGPLPRFTLSATSHRSGIVWITLGGFSLLRYCAGLTGRYCAISSGRAGSRG